MASSLKELRRAYGLSLDELATALGSGFSRARLSVAERGLIELTKAEQSVIEHAIERLGSLRSQVRRVVETAQALDLTALCADIRAKARGIHA